MESENKIIDSFINNHTEEAIQLIEKQDPDEVVELLKSIPIELASMICSKSDRLQAAHYIEKSDPDFAIDLLIKCKPSISANIFRLLDKQLTLKLLEGMPTKYSDQIQQIIKFPINTVGAHIDPMVLTLDENTSIGNALIKIKNHNADIHSPIFILTSGQVLTGYIDLKSLISGIPSQPVRSIMKKDYPKIMGSMHIQTLLNRDLKDNCLLDFPVVDINGVFLGIIDRRSVVEKTTGKNVMINREKQTGMALGDLYQIGLSGLIGSVTEILWNK